MVVDKLRNRLIHQFAQTLDGFNGFGPIMAGLINTDQRTQGGQREAGVLECRKRLFGAIQHSSLEIVLGNFMLCVLALLDGQICPGQQTLMDAYGAFHLPTPAKQAAQGKMQLSGLRVELGDLNKSVDGSVGFLVEKKIQALEIGVRQVAGLGQHMPKIKPGCHPAQSKKQRQKNQPPGFKIHVVDPEK